MIVIYKRIVSIDDAKDFSKKRLKIPNIFWYLKVLEIKDSVLYLFKKIEIFYQFKKDSLTYNLWLFFGIVNIQVLTIIISFYWYFDIYFENL